MRLQDLSYRERGGRRGVDHSHAGAGDAFDDRPQQRVMRTPQQERVDDGSHHSAIGEERQHVAAHRGLGLGRVGFPGLHKRYERGAGLLDHVGEWVEIA